MDIICLKCGKHLIDVEDAREHSRECKGNAKSEGFGISSNGNIIKKVESNPDKPNTKITPEQWSEIEKALTESHPSKKEDPNAPEPLTELMPSSPKIPESEPKQEPQFVNEPTNSLQQERTIPQLSASEPERSSPEIPTHEAKSVPPNRNKSHIKSTNQKSRSPAVLLVLVVVAILGVCIYIFLINKSPTTVVAIPPPINNTPSNTPIVAPTAFPTLTPSSSTSLPVTTLSFTTIEAPSNLRYSVLDSLHPTFQWTPSDQNDSFDLQIAGDPDFANLLKSTSGLTDSSITIIQPRFDLNKTYYWRIRAVSNSGIKSEWAQSQFPVSTKITSVVPITSPTQVVPTTKVPTITPTTSIVPSLTVTPIQPATVTTASIPTPDRFVPGLPSSINRTSFQAIDQYALGTPSSVTQSVADLASYLTKPAKNDYDKARSIYRWITQNISYDFSAYLSGRYNSTAAADVLVSRTSVCQGYSSLFYALAKSAGLEVVTINGWAKGYGYGIGDQISGPTNHAWNAVQIGGGWYLIDSTWGAGHISQQQFVRDFDEFYFLSPPDQFIYNHFPEDSKWQLLNVSVTKNEFAALPYVYSDFFKYGISLDKNTQSVMNVRGNLNMTFSVPVDTYLIARLWEGDTELAETFSSAVRSGNLYIINVTFPASSSYILTIYASKSMYGMYDGVLDYKVIVTN